VALLWGLVLAIWLCRGFLFTDPGTIPWNHDKHRYPYRLVEFRACLEAGYFSPQWCSHFRGGLGSPCFSYYEHGLLYVASMFPWSLSAVHALGLALVLFSTVGYASVFTLLKERFGAVSGFLGASGLLLSSYAGTEIYLRGALSEFSAMMMWPGLLVALCNWMESGQRLHIALVALCGCAIIVLHPIALPCYVAAICLIVLYGVWLRQPYRILAAIIAMGIGAGIASFYWLTLLLEWELVWNLTYVSSFFHYANHFTGLSSFVRPYVRSGIVPVSLGPVVPGFIVLNALLMFCLRRQATAEQKRLLVSMLVLMVVSVFLMNGRSEFIWRNVSLLRRLEFPWRLMVILTTTSSIALGCLLPVGRKWIRVVVAALTIALMLYNSSYYTSYIPYSFRAVENAAQISEFEYFGPEGNADMFLPRGASRNRENYLRAPSVSGKGAVSDFRREAGRMSCTVHTEEAIQLTLPHFFFPVGWSAEFAGEPIEISREDFGLMRFDLPGGKKGELRVQFATTPARRLSLWIAAASCVIGVVLLATLGSQGRKSLRDKRLSKSYAS
jgi:hypothetical protein